MPEKDNFRNWPADTPTSEMTHEERIAFLRDVERLEIRASKHARRIREKLEEDSTTDA